MKFLVVVEWQYAIHAVTHQVALIEHKINYTSCRFQTGNTISLPKMRLTMTLSRRDCCDMLLQSYVYNVSPSTGDLKPTKCEINGQKNEAKPSLSLSLFLPPLTNLCRRTAKSQIRSGGGGGGGGVESPGRGLEEGHPESRRSVVLLVSLRRANRNLGKVSSLPSAFIGSCLFEVPPGLRAGLVTPAQSKCTLPRLRGARVQLPRAWRRRRMRRGCTRLGREAT